MGGLRLLAACMLLAICMQTHVVLGIAALVPVDYRFNQTVPLLVSKMSSTRTELPYSYYSLPMCPPPDNVISYDSHANLGEQLLGEVAETSPYEVGGSVISRLDVDSLSVLDSYAAR
jgi:transmembrane 9 superfamily protein 2/4